jgi:hypothetical protein
VSWFDKVGDAFNYLKDTAAPAIGGAMSAAQHAVDSNPVTGALDNALNPIHALVANQVTAPLVDQGTGVVGSAFSYGIARPLSTFTQQVEDASQQGASAGLLLDKDRWRQAWNNSADVSPGQALVIGSGLAPKGLNYDMTPDAMKAREDFFHDSWQGQVSSGALDLALNLGADPTMLAARAIKGAALARNTFKDASEVDRVLKVNAGETAASRRESGLSTRMDKFFGQLDGKTPAEIALHPVVKESDQSGAFAYMFGRVNSEFADEAERRAAQRNVFGAMLGNGDSITALKDQHTLLANELQRLSDTPVASQAVGHFTWDDHGQGMLDIANQAEPAEITAQKDAIEAELLRLENVTSATGTVNRLAGTRKEQGQYNRQLQSLRQSTLNTGLGNMPVRVIGGAIANRLPGHVSVKDPVSGFEDLRNTLSQAPHLAGAERRQLLDNYVNAATDGDRQKAVYDAEGAIVHSTAARYGMTPAQARKLAEAGNGRRAAVMSTLASRLYSAAPEDKFVHLVDPEAGEVYAISRPILQSQIEDHVSIIDPRELDKALKGTTQGRLLERVAGQLGDDAKNVATSAYDTAGSAQMVASDVLTKITRGWKDMALMRLAYPARVQIDSQMRLMTHMASTAFMSTVPGAFKGEAKYLLSKQGGDKLSLANILKPGDYETAVGDILRKGGVHDEDIPGVVRRLAQNEGGMADLASEMGNAQLARFRATGEWGYVDPANANWAGSWQRAVNRQIRNSPVAMKATEGATADELKAFVQSNPAARKEWLNLKASNGDDLDGWVSRVQAHVDHYLPTAEQRSTVLERDVSGADIEGWFGGDAGVASRMRVHGESYSPTEKSPWTEWYEQKRNAWYQFAAEAPETVMAKAPLYSYAFKRNMVDIVARHGGEDAIDAEALTNIRKSADRLARREVGKILYDTSHSSNLSRSMRYVSPFFGAWEDMVKKWGGLFYDKPWTAVRFEQAWNAPNNAGIVVDENGNRVDALGNRFDPNTGRKLDPVKDKYLIGKRELVTIPARFLPRALQDAVGIGELDSATDKKRRASIFSIDKNSFNIVFQGDPWWLPGAGPLAQVPVNELVKHGMIKNTDSPVVQALLPYGVSDNPIQDQFLPSWARNAKAAFFHSGQEYANTRAMLLAQETDRWQNGERKTKPSADEIDNMARNWFILKAITSEASPVSMAPTAKTQFYIDQAHIYKQQYARTQGMLNQYIQKYGLEDGKAKFDTEHPDWKTQYLKDFRPWFDMSLSMSDNESGIVATDTAVDISRQPAVRKMIRDDPEYGWYFVGAANQYGNTPGSAFSQTAYAQQEFLGDRGQSKPEDALAKSEASKGWMQYQSVMTRVNTILHDRGLHSFQQKGAEDLKEFKANFTNYMMTNNESWKKDFLNTDQGKISNFLDVANKAMATSPTFAKQPQNVALGQYMQARQAVQKILSNRQVKNLDDPGNVDVKGVWDGIVSYLVNDNIGFEQIYNRLLQNDDPSKSIPGVTTNAG